MQNGYKKQSEKVMKLKWQPRNGFDKNFLIRPIQVDFCQFLDNLPKLLQ